MLLRIGFSSLLGASLPSLFAGRASATKVGMRPIRAKSLLLVFVTGGPSHIDTFDPKPDAPAEIRGDFGTIATRTAGVRFGEHLPQLAARSDQFALVRTLALRSGGFAVHQPATHLVLTGRDALPPGAGFLASRHDWPCFAAAVDYLRPAQGGLPTGVTLPTYITDAGIGYSGQDAGFLGARHDPWFIARDPSRPDFRVDGVTMPIEVSLGRIENRRALLDEFDAQRSRIDRLGGGEGYSNQQRQAFDVLSSGRLATALDLAREPDRLRDRYGRHLMGQSLLLARRLIEAGIPIVQANMGYSAQWDTHTQNCATLKNVLLPPFDQSLSALFDDLTARGLLGETLIVVVGEFGRTPKLGGFVGTNVYNPTGRDHWTPCFSGLFAGAGVRGGQVIGRSDQTAAFPLDEPYYPSDIGATIFDALGIDLQSKLPDQLGRLIALNEGRVIERLYE